MANLYYARLPGCDRREQPQTYSSAIWFCLNGDIWHNAVRTEIIRLHAQKIMDHPADE